MKEGDLIQFPLDRVKKAKDDAENKPEVEPRMLLDVEKVVQIVTLLNSIAINKPEVFSVADASKENDLVSHASYEQLCKWVDDCDYEKGAVQKAAVFYNAVVKELKKRSE